MVTPNIRFKGFTDDWEQRKLGELMDVTSVKRIHQSDWTDSGIRFLRARDIVAESKNEEVTESLFISEEKYEEYSALSGKVKPGDLLVTGVGTIGVPMLIKSDEPVYFKDGNIIWFKNENRIDGKFFYHSFNGEGVQKFIKESAGIGTVGTYTIDSGKKTPINLPPSKEEQIKIGEYFDDLDNLITLHQRKCDDTKMLKKYMLSKMFPKNGAKKPEIRFAGFTDDWEQRKLGDCFLERSEKRKNEDEELLSVTIADGVIKQADSDKRNTASADTSNYKMVYPGDLAYNSMRMWQGAEGMSNFRGIVSPAYTIIEPYSDIDSRFFAYMFKRVDMLKTFERNSQGLTSDTWNLKYPALSKICVSVPSIAEQKQISEFIEGLDNLITLHQRKCDELKEVKKYMLQNMFPKA